MVQSASTSNERREEIMAVLRGIPDPEMPISIVDLGLVERLEITPGASGDRVSIDILPTFVGCPALPMIESDITTQVGALDDIASVTVRFVHDPPWSVDRISAAGRESLRTHGVTVPERGTGGSGGAQTVTLRTSAVPCPFCGSRATSLDSAFGPTRCRMIYYCDSCRNSFEHMKRV
jgi:ring-1,2-phenylacetyl-CoA epoxidase subunit PaaD